MLLTQLLDADDLTKLEASQREVLETIILTELVSNENVKKELANHKRLSEVAGELGAKIKKP